ncbi:uncharacterized protein TNCV_5058921 [Trichonephila clavipes]|nr:uncharacterized protein TNCV_5058921 [Trichonephila clavipes]
MLIVVDWSGFRRALSVKRIISTYIDKYTAMTQNTKSFGKPWGNSGQCGLDPEAPGAAVAEWYRYRIGACLVTSSSHVPLKTRRVGQRCTLNLSRAETSFRWCGVVVRRGGASSGVVHVT